MLQPYLETGPEHQTQAVPELTDDRIPEVHF